MFFEFNDNELKWWNDLSNEEKKRLMENYEVDLAVDIEIIKKSSERILEEHKFYQMSQVKPCELIDGIVLNKVYEDSVEFIISVFHNSDIDKKQISVKLNEEKSFDSGFEPYTIHYIVKVSNLKYGTVREL